MAVPGQDASPDFVLNLIRRFLPHHDFWSSVTSAEELEITRITSGFINRNYVIRRQNPDSRHESKLLLKLYGGNVATDDSEVTLSVEQELLVCSLWSKVGNGPKMLAVFAGGRLEEFIESSVYKPNDYKDPVIRSSLAKSLALFHSLDLPFPRPAFDFCSLLHRMHQDFKSKERKRIHKNPVLKDKDINIQPVAWFDYEHDINCLSKLLTKEHQRLVLTQGDLHGHNILIRSDDKQVVMIDLQESGYSWRGRDIGLFLINSAIDIDNLKVDDEVIGFPDDEDVFPFLDEYMDAVQELGSIPDLDRSGKDSREHLVMEAMTGGLASIMYVLLLIMGRQESMLRASPHLAVCLIALFNSYMACRRQLGRRFASLAFEQESKDGGRDSPANATTSRT